MSKQDRQGARTPADIERRYNVRKAMGAASSSLSAASSAQAMASNAQTVASSAKNAADEASASASEAKAEAENKVGKTDDAQIITMINRAQEIIHLIGKRLKIESENFTLTETGKVTMSDATIKSSRVAEMSGEEVEVATEIKEGTIILEPDYKLLTDESGVLTAVDLELLRFKHGGLTFGLFMVAKLGTTGTGEDEKITLTLDSFHISEITE